MRQNSPILLNSDILREHRSQNGQQTSQGSNEPMRPNIIMRDLDFVDGRGGPRRRVQMRMRRIGGVDTFVPLAPTIRFTERVRRFIRQVFFQHLCDGNFISDTHIIDNPNRRTHLYGRCNGLRNATNPIVERPIFSALPRSYLS